MSAIFKTLTGIIPSNQTAIVFTDNMIVDESILDVFFSNDDIVVDDMTMSGNSVTVTISPQSYNVGVALFINNCEVFTPYDDTEVLNRLTIVETDTETLNTEVGELDTEVGELNTELDTLTNTVNNKQDKLPDVVNDRYLHTNAATGELEWSTVQGDNDWSLIGEFNLTSSTTIPNMNTYKELYFECKDLNILNDRVIVNITSRLNMGAFNNTSVYFLYLGTIDWLTNTITTDVVSKAVWNSNLIFKVYGK